MIKKLKDKTAQEILQEAILELNNLEQNQEFLVKDLFKGYEWALIPRGVRLTVGTLFLSHVNSNDTNDIVSLGKTSSNQQKYKKL